MSSIVTPHPPVKPPEADLVQRRLRDGYQPGPPAHLLVRGERLGVEGSPLFRADSTGRRPCPCGS
jgi:hypothetical protein